MLQMVIQAKPAENRPVAFHLARAAGPPTAATTAEACRARTYIAGQPDDFAVEQILFKNFATQAILFIYTGVYRGGSDRSTGFGRWAGDAQIQATLIAQPGVHNVHK